MKPRHLPIKNTRTRDLREKKFRKEEPFGQLFKEFAYELRKQREAEETQWD